MIQTLRETQAKKWTEAQIKSYELFLYDLESYVKNYVYTMQVWDFNAFINAMLTYGEQTNPIGFELYNSQIDYLSARSEGKHVKLEKKKKGGNQEAKKETKPAVIREQKEEEFVRKEDPTITTEELLTRPIDQTKYTADIVSFQKETANLIFIGHVDSGKSTLTGNIMKELKQVDEQELARNKQEAKENHM